MSRYFPTVCLETGLSKSSVIRFCQAAGFDGYFDFMETYRGELELIESEFLSGGQDFAKLQGELALQPWYGELVKALKAANTIIFYGPRQYMEQFRQLIRLLRLTKTVIDAKPISIEETNLVCETVGKDALYFIVEPEQTWLSLKDFSRISPELPAKYLLPTQKTVLISRNGGESSGIQVTIPSDWSRIQTMFELNQLSLALCQDLMEVA